MKKAIVPDGAPKPGGPYSHAVAAGGLVFVAGQVGRNPGTGELPESFEEQARITFRNLETVARAAGGSLADAVRVGVYLRDMANFAAMNRIYEEFVPEPRPARTTIQSNIPYEIEVDAVLAIG